jgi:hypothetical protein
LAKQEWTSNASGRDGNRANEQGTNTVHASILRHHDTAKRLRRWPCGRRVAFSETGAVPVRCSEPGRPCFPDMPVSLALLGTDLFAVQFPLFPSRSDCSRDQTGSQPQCLNRFKMCSPATMPRNTHTPLVTPRISQESGRNNIIAATNKVNPTASPAIRASRIIFFRSLFDGLMGARAL